MIINKCMERSGGLFNKIPEFINLKREPIEGGGITIEDTINYDPETVFLIGFDIATKTFPGEFSGEKIKPEDRLHYIKLSKINDWRRKLSDMWEIVMTIDKKKWNSVTHYHQANKFKKNHPDLYNSFSLDSGSTLSKDSIMAYNMGESGIHNGKKIRQDHIKKDHDLSVLEGEYTKEELIRLKALKEKFKNNEFKKILKETQNSKIMYYVKKNHPRLAKLLIKIRNNM